MSKGKEIWYKDRYFMVFFGTMIIAIAAIMSNPYLITKQNETILARVDQLAAERQAESDAQTIDIINETQGLIKTNGKLIEKVIDAQNITVIVGEHEDANGTETLTAELKKENVSQGTGAISGLGKPIIIQ